MIGCHITEEKWGVVVLYEQCWWCNKPIPGYGEQLVVIVYIITQHYYTQDRMYKIEKAFKKFDLNGDGYLSWEEFSQVPVQ